MILRDKMREMGLSLFVTWKSFFSSAAMSYVEVRVSLRSHFPRSNIFLRRRVDLYKTQPCT